MTDQRPQSGLGIRRALFAIVIGFGVVVGVAVVSVVTASDAGAAPATVAQQNSPVTSPTVSMPSIIPKPNSGAEPKVGTDRGGWVQWTVMGGMVVALGIIVLLARRESHRKRAALVGTTPADAAADHALP